MKSSTPKCLHRFSGLTSLKFLLTITALLASYWAGQHSFLNEAVNWKLQAATRMLQGGNYLDNFFDDANPYVFALFIPTIWLHQLLSLTWSQATNLYLLILNSISLLLCYLLIEKCFTGWLRQTVYYTALISLLYFSLLIAGQREHLIVIGYLPYFLLTTQQSSKKTPSTLAMTCALFAALGLAQEPFYLIIPVFISLLDYHYFKKQWPSHQTYFYLISVLFLMLSYWVYPGYYQVILPLLYCFEDAYNTSWLHLIFGYVFLTVLLTNLVAIYYLLKPKKSEALLKYTVASLLGLLIFFVEHKEWFYHIYPAVAFGLLLYSLMITQTLTQEGFVISKNTLLMAMLTLGWFLLCTFYMMSFLNHYYIKTQLQSSTNQLISYAKRKFQGKTAIVFSTRIHPAYLLSTYTDTRITMPWSNAWLLPRLINQNHLKNPGCLYKEGKKMFYHLVLMTLSNKPDFILINSNKTIRYLKKDHMRILMFLKQNQPIKKQLLDYQPAGYINGYLVLQHK